MLCRCIDDVLLVLLVLIVLIVLIALSAHDSNPPDSLLSPMHHHALLSLYTHTRAPVHVLRVVLACMFCMSRPTRKVDTRRRVHHDPFCMCGCHAPTGEGALGP